MKKPRVYTAVFNSNSVLMVRHVHEGRDYWTLPGGAVEFGETRHAAAIREVFEETGIHLANIHELFIDGTETCFFSQVEDGVEAFVGIDPELAGREQWIKEIKWFPLEEKRSDKQVEKVLAVLLSKGQH